MSGTRLLVAVLALLAATLVGFWTIQNHLYRQEVITIVSEVGDMLRRAQVASLPTSTDERILELRTELVSLNAGLDAQLQTRSGLIDLALAGENVESMHELLNEMKIVIEQSRQFQSELQRALMSLTDQYARKISEIEQQSSGAARTVDLLGRAGTVLALIGSISVMALGWRKDAREAAESRRKAAAVA